MIGSMASILWAVFVTVAAALYDRHFGFGLLNGLDGLFAAPDK